MPTAVAHHHPTSLSDSARGPLLWGPTPHGPQCQWQWSPLANPEKIHVINYPATELLGGAGSSTECRLRMDHDVRCERTC